MALKILVLLVVSTLSSALPDPGVNINVKINVAEDAGNELGPDSSHSFFFCGVDFNPPGTEYLNITERQILLSIKLNELSKLTDYCNETIPFTNLSAEDIEFRLYNSTTTNYSRLITNDPASVDSSSLNTSLPLLVVAHGWTEDVDDARTAAWMNQIKDQWLKKMTLNVMLVQWKNLAANLIYPLAVNNAKFVGTELAALLKFLKSYTGLSPSNTHIVGLSLGAQVAGVAGQQLDNLSRITGLDPAGPLFSGAPLSERLDASDADFVDVIHTNAGGLGFAKPCGHVDFYMNGGTFQIGCQISDPNSTFNTCSHALAPFYYIESLVTREHSYGFLCENQMDFQAGICLNNASNTIGYGVKPDPAGVFYSDTTQVLCQKLSTFLTFLTCK